MSNHEQRPGEENYLDFDMALHVGHKIKPNMDRLIEFRDKRTAATESGDEKAANNAYIDSGFEASIVEHNLDNSERLITLFRVMKESPQIGTLFEKAASNAQRHLGNQPLADEIKSMWAEPAEDSFEVYDQVIGYRYSPLARVVETVGLAAVDLHSQDSPYLTLVSGDNSQYQNGRRPIKDVSMKEVRDTYILLGLGAKVDFIPEIPKPGRRNSQQYVLQGLALENYGVDLSMYFISASRGTIPYTKIRADQPAHVILSASKSQPVSR
jgi:hypothetical protein